MKKIYIIISLLSIFSFTTFGQTLVLGPIQKIANADTVNAIAKLGNECVMVTGSGSKIRIMGSASQSSFSVIADNMRSYNNMAGLPNDKVYLRFDSADNKGIDPFLLTMESGNIKLKRIFDMPSYGTTTNDLSLPLKLGNSYFLRAKNAPNAANNAGFENWWVTDLTAANTYAVHTSTDAARKLAPNASGAPGRSAVLMGGKIYYKGGDLTMPNTDAANGRWEIYVWDGVKNSTPVKYSNFQIGRTNEGWIDCFMTSGDSVFYYNQRSTANANFRLARGTANPSTPPVLDGTNVISNDYIFANRNDVFLKDSLILFAGSQVATLTNIKLFKYNLKTFKFTQITDFNTGASDSVGWVKNYGGKMYFIAYSPSAGRDLYTYNPANSQVSKVRELDIVSSGLGVYEVNDSLVLFSNQESTGFKAFISNGVTSTQLDIPNLKGYISKAAVSNNGYLFFVRDETRDTVCSVKLNPTGTVSVTGITVNSAGNATSIALNQTLQMSVDVLPANATNKAVTWSIATGGTGTATINANGLLQPTAVGTVNVKATANDGSGISGTKTITINVANGVSTADAESIKVLPNPVTSTLQVTGNNIKSVEITNLNGKVVLSSKQKKEVIDVSGLSKGVYLVRIKTTNGNVLVKKITKM